MKLNKKLIAPMLGLASCMAIGVGTTYALFTSSDEVNIAVTAGKVKVSAALSLDGAKSLGAVTTEDNDIVNVDYLTGADASFNGEYAWHAATSINGGYVFENGGSAICDGKTITLDRMTPGDHVEARLTIDGSETNVNALYRLHYEVLKTDGTQLDKSAAVFCSGLKVDNAGESFNRVAEFQTAWMTLPHNVFEIPLTIELPIEAGNIYQDKACMIKYTVEAVQGNAAVKHEEIRTVLPEIMIADKLDLASFAASVNAGDSYVNKTVGLISDIAFEDGEIWTPIGTSSHPFSGSFSGLGYSIHNMQISGGNYVGLFGYTKDAIIEDIHFTGADVVGGSRVGTVIGRIVGSTTLRNCTIDATSSVKGTDSNTGAFVGEATQGASILLKGLTNYASIVNTASSNSRAGGILGQTTSGAASTIKDCVNRGRVTTNNGYAGGIVSAYQSGSLLIDHCENSGTLIGAYKGDLLGWMTSCRSIRIDNYEGEKANIIGAMDTSNGAINMQLNGITHFVNKTSPVTKKFVEIYSTLTMFDTDRADRLIAFYRYAKQHNPAFADYPETYYALFESVGGYSQDWNSLLNGFNAESGMNLQTSEFDSAWKRSADIYYIAA